MFSFILFNLSKKQQQICYFSQALSQWFVEIWRVYILYPLVSTLEQELSSRSTKYVSLRHLRVSQGYAKASPAPRDPYRLGGGENCPGPRCFQK